ncbi:MAG: KEOPS complex subunit [Candidatus Methanomethylicota archaeon]|nr:KEOPS complex subunit Pcc1 [Candidatus Culexmicrobium cathedralense]RLE49059.1 MAG: KEOPS complex subunit [Candidatus Verstraetearchaeota archaeon]
MKHCAFIRICYGDDEVAEAIACAVEPDNLQAPRGLAVAARKVDGEVEVEIECEGKVETLLQTLDDLLSCIQAAEKSLNFAQQSYKEDCSNHVKLV